MTWLPQLFAFPSTPYPLMLVYRWSFGRRNCSHSLCKNSISSSLRNHPIALKNKFQWLFDKWFVLKKKPMSLLPPGLLRVEGSWSPRLHWGKVSPCKVMHKVQNHPGILVDLLSDVCTQSHSLLSKPGLVLYSNRTKPDSESRILPGTLFSVLIFLVPPTSTHVSIVNVIQTVHILHFKEVGLESLFISKKKGTSKLIVTQNHFYWCRKQNYFNLYFLFVWSVKRERYFKRE